MEYNMTSGNITKQILVFSTPIVLGNLFQQLFNTADAIIAGRLIGNEAFASISVANPIMSVVLFFLVGLTLGMNALLARHYGAGEQEEFRKKYSTALTAGIGFTVLVSSLCICFSRQLLILFATPEAILDDTNHYLQIIFAGMTFSFLYNFFANVLRAIGDSKAAFLFLGISCTVNVVLDIAIISLTGLGVSGAAVATVLSQLLSVILCLIYIYTRYPMLALRPENLVFDAASLGIILSYSWAAALQQSFLYIGRLLVQSSINVQGIDMITGYNAAFRLENFELAFIEGTGNGLATFAGQNLGAKRYDRINKGFRNILTINIIYVAFCMALMYLLPRQLVGLYLSTENKEAMAYGVAYVTTIPPAYVFTAFNACSQGLFRGTGRNRICMRGTFIQIFLRASLTILLVPVIGIYGVCVGCSTGWVVMTIHNYFSKKTSDPHYYV